jgi:hypothetical protein
MTVDISIGVRSGDAIGELDRHVVVDGVHHLGAVERDARDVPILLADDLRCPLCNATSRGAVSRQR